MKVLFINSTAIIVSAIPYIEDGLRLTGLVLSIGYTVYKFVSDYRNNKKEKQ